MTRTGLAPALRRLFDELWELAPARAARLARVRAEDPVLAGEVEALLTAAAEAPEFLERPARESELVGHSAGPWRIEARLSPRVLARLLRGDLDALCARALALERAERYPTVEALARDVEAWLAHQPVAARPAGVSRRAFLALHRHPVAGVVGLALVLALVLGALALRHELRRSRAEASLGWRAHAQAVLATRWIEDLARAAGRGPALENALDQARAQLAREPDMPPEGEGRLRMTLGTLYLETGRPRDARLRLGRKYGVRHVSSHGHLTARAYPTRSRPWKEACLTPYFRLSMADPGGT
jgi:hypothetical protein